MDLDLLVGQIRTFEPVIEPELPGGPITEYTNPKFLFLNGIQAGSVSHDGAMRQTADGFAVTIEAIHASEVLVDALGEATHLRAILELTVEAVPVQTPAKRIRLEGGTISARVKEADAMLVTRFREIIPPP